MAQQVVVGEINAEILSLSAYAGSLLNIEGTVNIDVRSKDMMKIERGLWTKVMMNKYPGGLGSLEKMKMEAFMYVKWRRRQQAAGEAEEVASYRSEVGIIGSTCPRAVI